MMGKKAAQGPIREGQGPEKMKERGVILTHKLSEYSSTCWGPASRLVLVSVLRRVLLRIENHLKFSAPWYKEFLCTDI